MCSVWWQYHNIIISFSVLSLFDYFQWYCIFEVVSLSLNLIWDRALFFASLWFSAHKSWLLQVIGQPYYILIFCFGGFLILLLVVIHHLIIFFFPFRIKREEIYVIGRGTSFSSSQLQKTGNPTLKLQTQMKNISN